MTKLPSTDLAGGRPGVVILGASGMLGQALVRVLGRHGYGVTAVVRAGKVLENTQGITHNIVAIDLFDKGRLAALIRKTRPYCIINATGVKTVSADSSAVAALFRVNALLPRLVADVSQATGARVLHFSTNAAAYYPCNASSRVNNTKSNDLYALSKLLGEVAAAHVVNVRCSMIGMNSSGRDSLLEWFLRASGPVEGYSNVIFNGLPVDEIGEVCADFVIPQLERCNRILNIGGPKISKADLLRLVAQVWERPDLTVIERYEPRVDQTLDCTHLIKRLGYKQKVWGKMLYETRRFYDDE
jgi:dTDP-4-dehydrorhamnose reductase